MQISQQIGHSSIQEKLSLRIATKPESQMVKSGSSFELSCEAIGTPPPVFTWLLNGKPIVGGQDNNLLEKLHNVGKTTVETSITRTTIKIPCAEKKHRGKYTCVVTNGFITEKADARIVVAGGQSKCSKEGQPPQIVQYTESRFEREGNTVQLFCRTIGAKSIAWYGPEREFLNHAPGYEVLENGDLLIRSASWKHLGVFTCVATNEFGEARAEAFFYPPADFDEETSAGDDGDLSFSL
ncbi:unnamed protein product, partial [Mesorhabditis belari]|uniref:Ig-like domain-containing protein n=1 Tax=Mesorhabditis belari TaxID=2138241 RepID=A0AAF3FNP6_9BILA